MSSRSVRDNSGSFPDVDAEAREYEDLSKRRRVGFSARKGNTNNFKAQVVVPGIFGALGQQ